jgi:peptidyl-prolyl cis-trans isomerase B (cyclophilin B)
MQFMPLTGSSSDPIENYAMTNQNPKTLWRTAIVLITLLLFHLCVQAQDSVSGGGSYEDLVRNANRLFNNGNLDEARKTAQQAIHLDANRFEAYALAAKIAAKQGSAAEAGELIQKSLALAPDEDSKARVRELAATLAVAGPRPSTSAPDAAKQPAAKADEPEAAVINTSEGTMVVQFWTDAAPKTIANFKRLARAGFYDGTCFHRVIKGFMIQGGDPLSKDPSKEASWGSGGPGYTIEAEFNDHPHVRGVLSMARTQDPNSAGCQFFICHGNPRNLDHQYTTFGKLMRGDDVLEKIATTGTHRPDRPNKRMEIINIKIVPLSSVK